MNERVESDTPQEPVAGGPGRIPVAVFSFAPLSDAEQAVLRNFLPEAEYVVVHEYIGDGAGTPALDAVIDSVTDLGISDFVIPTVDSLGPMSPDRFIKHVLGPLDDAMIRLVAASDPSFDSAPTGEHKAEAEAFFRGVRWAVSSRSRKIADATKQWHADKLRLGERTGRLPRCSNCGHFVTTLKVKNDRDQGHLRLKGNIGSCRRPGCGCAKYVARNEKMMGN